MNITLSVAVTIIALFQLWKDWKAHAHPLRRWILLGVILFCGVGNVYMVWKTGKQHEADQQNIAGLKQAVDSATQSQESNTHQFVDSFGKLSQKVSDLQTEVRTEALQKKLATVQLELQNTQKALAPPKAKLLFTFLPYDVGVLGQKGVVPNTDVTLPRNLGIVHVEFTVLNPTEVEAENGQITVIICQECRYAREPDGFTKLDDRPDYERYVPFSVIRAKGQYQTLRLDLFVPLQLKHVPVGVNYRCHNCDIVRSNDGLFGMVHIQK
jgi:hypothetical protein